MLSQLKKGEIESYILITEENRKQCLKIGRIIHIIELVGSVYIRRGMIDVRPILKRGTWKISESDISGAMEVYVRHDEDVNMYKRSFESIIDHIVKRKIGYINPDQKPINYLFKK